MLEGMSWARLCYGTCSLSRSRWVALAQAVVVAGDAQTYDAGEGREDVE